MAMQAVAGGGRSFRANASGHLGSHASG